MKNLIVLKGASTQGKSSVLNLLRKGLEDHPDYATILSKPHPNGHDWISIVKGHFGKVGIITFGDPGTEEHIESILNEMHEADVTIIFATSRTRGSGWNMLYEFAASKDYKLIATEVLSAKNFDDKKLIGELNASEVTMLTALIEKLSKW